MYSQARKIIAIKESRLNGTEVMIDYENLISVGGIGMFYRFGSRRVLRF